MRRPVVALAPPSIIIDLNCFNAQNRGGNNGYEWINHSLDPKPVVEHEPRIRFGGPDCSRPYEASPLNISAMSFGALSRNAILALNKGAKIGGFFHNTGEGGISPYHLEYGADLVWQIGTGYFGCRDSKGRFDEALFADKACLDQVKVIEIKLSQGAKPGHGGILPAVKLTPEIAAIRHVPMGQDVISPPAHTAFSSPLGLLEFVARLRDLAGGKPVGFKLCIGRKSEFLAICKAMLETGITPDFITVDGSEGGTGAAPIELTNSVGTPLRDGLIFVRNALVGIGLRDQVRLIAAGKAISAFHVLRLIALGADTVNSARAMMFALGCIQSRHCNRGTCPTGVATQDPARYKALHVDDKASRVARYHRSLFKNLMEMVGAAGLARISHHPSTATAPWHALAGFRSVGVLDIVSTMPARSSVAKATHAAPLHRLATNSGEKCGLASLEELEPHHINRRVQGTETRNYAELYPCVADECLLSGVCLPETLRSDWEQAGIDHW